MAIVCRLSLPAPLISDLLNSFTETRSLPSFKASYSCCNLLAAWVVVQDQWHVNLCGKKTYFERLLSLLSHVEIFIWISLLWVTLPHIYCNITECSTGLNNCIIRLRYLRIQYSWEEQTGRSYSCWNIKYDMRLITNQVGKPKTHAIFYPFSMSSWIIGLFTEFWKYTDKSLTSEMYVNNKLRKRST